MSILTFFKNYIDSGQCWTLMKVSYMLYLDTIVEPLYWSESSLGLSTVPDGVLEDASQLYGVRDGQASKWRIHRPTHHQGQQGSTGRHHHWQKYIPEIG